MSRFLVLDTNIVVSAGLGSGPPAQIVARVLRRQLAVAVSPGILGEYLDVIQRPKFRPAGFPPGWIPELLRVAIRIPGEPPGWKAALPDPSDGKFLALAKVAGAVLITGNIKHFPSEGRDGVEVVTPHDYLKSLILLENSLG